jgi:hypothetical protein
MWPQYWGLTNLGDLQRDLMGVKSHPTKKNINFASGLLTSRGNISINYSSLPRIKESGVIQVVPVNNYIAIYKKT